MYPTVCLICARKRAEYIENQESRKAAARASYYIDNRVRALLSMVISADPKKKKVACRTSYNASPEKKRAASRVSYRADPEEKRAASRVASRASGLLTACSSI